MSTNHQYQVLVADALSEEGLQILRAEPQLAVDVKTGMTPAQLVATVGAYDGLIVRSATKVTAEVLAQAKRLKVVGRAGVGLDNIAADAASKRGIIVMNVPGGNTISTAEHTMSLLLAMSRNIPQACADTKSGRWNRGKFMGTELYGKILGIVGLGRIGTEVAKRAHAFGMRIIAHDPYLSLERARQLEVSVVTLEELLRQADFITVHTPLSAETKHLIGREQLQLVKPGVRIINCARGGIVEESALAEAIKEGRVAGAAVDVFETEPPKDSPLLGLEQVVVTPHLGASTEEAQVNVAIEMAKQMADALLGRGIRNATNMPSVDGQTLQAIQPYIHLAEKLGMLLAQLAESHVSTVKVTYIGDVTHHETSPITMALLKGLLEPMVGETVNYVNASLIAAERGIKVVEAKSSQTEEFAQLIAVEVQGEKVQVSAQGTLLTKKDPRIVRINRFFVDAAPSGYMLFIENQDRPGLIGGIGTILGEAGINIAGMTFGRATPGGDAITVLNVDNPVPKDVLARIKSSTHVVNARLIKL